MGFWNISAANLQKGDEVRLHGETYATVLKTEPIGKRGITVHLKWDHARPFTDTLDRDENLMVRR